jgi:hypothetical protein
VTSLAGTREFNKKIQTQSQVSEHPATLTQDMLGKECPLHDLRAVHAQQAQWLPGFKHSRRCRCTEQGLSEYPQGTLLKQSTMVATAK